MEPEDIMMRNQSLVLENQHLKDQINDLIRERDEARRDVCNLIQAHSQLWCKDIAKHRGWDCFKEDGK